MNNEYLGHDIPKLGFGLMRLPEQDGKIDIRLVKQMVDTFLANGFTYFDTAYVYHNGESEIAAREALVERHPRSAFQLATKLPVWDIHQPADLMHRFNTSLARTGAGYFDFYLLHALDRSRLSDLDRLRMWDFMQDLKARGLIRHAGFSFHDTADVLDRILTLHPEMEFVQLQINYVDWESEDVQARACCEVARQHQVPVIVMEPVKGGALAVMPPSIQQLLKQATPTSSVASWAMRYAASLEGIVTVLSGMSNPEQLADNILTMKDFVPVTADEKDLLAEVVRRLQAIPTIPCTDCKYCVPECPQKINIPGAFSAINTYTTYNNLDSAKGHYRWVMGPGGKASDCIACAACEGHCPQHIPIIANLRKVASLLE